MKFFKYHALGNDYLVIDPKDFPGELTEQKIRVICHRNFGVGSDGILWGPLPSEKPQFALRIFNPATIRPDPTTILVYVPLTLQLDETPDSELVPVIVGVRALEMIECGFVLALII